MRKHAAKNTLTVAAAAMLALAATGCTSGEQHSAHVTWLSESAGDPIWSIEANTFDDKPVIVGDVVLGLVTERPQLLELAAWDLKTGQELWKRKVSPGLGYLNEENESYDSWGVEVVQSLDDGKPLVAALNPVRTVVYDTKDDTGTYGMQEQTISFLDPKTGEEVAESESAYRVLDEFRASNFGVGSEVASINLDTFVPLDEGMEWTKKIIFSDGSSVDAAPKGYQQLMHTRSFSIVLNEETEEMEIMRYDGQRVHWNHPLSDFEFGSNDKIVSGINGFGSYIFADGDKNLGVAQFVVTEDPDQDGKYESRYISAVLDYETGEILWEALKARSVAKGVFSTGKHISQTVDGYIHDLSSDEQWQKRDLRTGDILWETTVAGVETDIDVLGTALEMFGEDEVLKNSESTWKLFSLADGAEIDVEELKIKKPKDGQLAEPVFGCSYRGPAMLYQLGGALTQESVDHTKNFFYTGCLIDGTRINNMGQLSKAAVANGSLRWVPLKTTPEDPQTVFKEQIRVIANESGVHAFKF